MVKSFWLPSLNHPEDTADFLSPKSFYFHLAEAFQTAISLPTMDLFISAVLCLPPTMELTLPSMEDETREKMKRMCFLISGDH